MAKLQRDDAKNLWAQMGEQRGWKTLVSVLEGYVEKSQGIEDSTVHALLCEARDFQRADERFPESASKLLARLNERIEDFRDCAERLKKDSKAQKTASRASKAESSARSEKSSGSKSGKSAQKKGAKADAKAGPKAQKPSEQKAEPPSESRSENQRRTGHPQREEGERRSGIERRVEQPSASGSNGKSKQTAQTGSVGHYDVHSDYRSQRQPPDWSGRGGADSGANNGIDEDWSEGDLRADGQPQPSQRKQSSQQNLNSLPETQPEAPPEKRMIRLTTSDPDHLHTLYKRGNFKTWDEVIAWLRQRTQGEHDYPEDMVQIMIEDIEKLKAHGVKLSDEPEQRFRLVRGKVVE